MIQRLIDSISGNIMIIGERQEHALLLPERSYDMSGLTRVTRVRSLHRRTERGSCKELEDLCDGDIILPLCQTFSPFGPVHNVMGEYVAIIVMCKIGLAWCWFHERDRKQLQSYE